jgi:hypothetical protein
MGANLNLNLNRSRLDKFTLVLPRIPSAPLLLDDLENQSDDEIIRNLMLDGESFRLSLLSANLPGLSIGESPLPTMFTAVSLVDMIPTFSPFSTELRVDKNYIVYKLMLLWLHLIKNPEGFNQFDNKQTYDLTTVNATLIVKGNLRDGSDKDYEHIMSFDFFDLRPISVPPIPFDFSNQGDEISLNIGWTYTYFMPRKSNGDPISLILTDKFQ